MYNLNSKTMYCISMATWTVFCYVAMSLILVNTWAKPVYMLAILIGQFGFYSWFFSGPDCDQIRSYYDLSTASKLLILALLVWELGVGGWGWLYNVDSTVLAKVIFLPVLPFLAIGFAYEKLLKN